MGSGMNSWVPGGWVDGALADGAWVEEEEAPGLGFAQQVQRPPNVDFVAQAPYYLQAAQRYRRNVLSWTKVESGDKSEMEQLLTMYLKAMTMTKATQ